MGHACVEMSPFMFMCRNVTFAKKLLRSDEKRSSAARAATLLAQREEVHQLHPLREANLGKVHLLRAQPWQSVKNRPFHSIVEIV